MLFVTADSDIVIVAIVPVVVVAAAVVGNVASVVIAVLLLLSFTELLCEEHLENVGRRVDPTLNNLKSKSIHISSTYPRKII